MLKILSPGYKISSKLTEVDSLRKSIKQNIESKVLVSKLELESINNMLDSLSPMNIINRGYAAVTVNGKMISSVSSINIDDDASIMIKGGTFKAKVTEIIEEN